MVGRLVDVYAELARLSAETGARYLPVGDPQAHHEDDAFPGARRGRVVCEDPVETA